MSDDWQVVEAHIKSRLNSAIGRLKSRLPEIETAVLRGQIEAYEDILALPSNSGPGLVPPMLRF